METRPAGAQELVVRGCGAAEDVGCNGARAGVGEEGESEVWVVEGVPKRTHEFGEEEGECGGLKRFC